jgi:LemA protein
MKGKSIALIVVAIVALLLLFSGCGAYNSLINEEENVNKSWGDVQSQYQRRADLIPNLVATVKGYATHEEKVLVEVTQARARATSIQVPKDALSDSTKLQEFENAQSQLGGALGRLLVVSEQYPDLKANENFLRLQDELAGTEERIKNARNAYNAAVQIYNTDVRRFPKNIFAGLFGFQQKAYFKSAAGSDVVPKVQF